MFQNIHLDKITSLNLNERLHVLATHRNKSENKTVQAKLDSQRFRMTQRLVKPSNGKKIKSEALSPDELRNQHVVVGQNKNLRKSQTFRTQSIHNNHFLFNPDFKFHLSNELTGRTAALSTHSPQKIKIKTSGLITIPSPQKPHPSHPNPPHPASTQKYQIHSSKRKYSLNSDKNNMISPLLREEHHVRVDRKEEFTQFQAQEVRKYQVYFRGRRRIWGKGDFTDADGFAMVEVGDSIAYRYEVIQELGKGAFGKVYRVEDHKKKQQVALKIIRSIPKLTKQSKIQIQILQLSTNSPQPQNNIVRIKGSFIFRSHTCITYQLLSQNLYQYLKSNKFHSTPQPILVKFTIQILHALAFLYGRKIVHCDIKPENLMLRERNKTGLRLIDLGSSCYEDQQFYTYIQSRYYRAPEVILGVRYTTAIDMWSLGCVLAEMHTGYPLFPGENQEEQLMMYIQLLGLPPNSLLEQGTRRKRFFNDNFQCRIIQSCQKYRMPKGLTFEKALQNCQNKQFIQFIKRCIEWQPSKRITPKEALLHDWILSGIPANIRARHIVQVTGEGINF